MLWILLFFYFIRIKLSKRKKVETKKTILFDLPLLQALRPLFFALLCRLLDDKTSDGSAADAGAFLALLLDDRTERRWPSWPPARLLSKRRFLSATISTWYWRSSAARRICFWRWREREMNSPILIWKFSCKSLFAGLPLWALLLLLLLSAPLCTSVCWIWRDDDLAEANDEKSAD